MRYGFYKSCIARAYRTSVYSARGNRRKKTSRKAQQHKLSIQCVHANLVGLA